MDIYANLVYQIYVDDKVIENVNILMNGDGSGREVAFHTIYNRLQQAGKVCKGSAQYQCNLCQRTVRYL